MVFSNKVSRLAHINFLINRGVKFTLNNDLNRLEVFSPQYLNIYTSIDRIPTLAFISALNLLVNKYGVKKIHVNFEDLLGLSAAAAVMLFAEITNLQLIKNSPDIITFTLPVEPNARKVFSEFDFFKAIKPGTRKKIDALLKNDCFFQTGTEPVIHAISAINALKKSGLKVMTSEARIFQASILEAMSNVKHHSYPDYYLDEFKRWWQFAYFDQNSSSLHFVVYDKGQGIPFTMRDLCSSSDNDGKKIEHALTYGVSSKVNEPGRGRGSKEILNTYYQNDNSSLLIYSGKGFYYIDKEDGTKIVDEEPIPISGTIIEWQIPYKAG